MNLNQVTLTVTDLERSIAFYESIGLALIVNSPGNAYARFECPDGDATFSLHEGPVPASTISVYFEVPDVKTRFEELSAAGVIFETPPTAQSWLWEEAWFLDPDGHRLCLYHAGKNRKDPPWRLQK